jgi:glycosyltransferase involved in cell wall biosynthesis
MTCATDGRKQPSVAVIICTRDRPDQIGGAVESVLANAYEDFTLLVVDQSTNSLTARALEPYAGSVRLRYLPSNTKGLSIARNIGVKETSAELILYTDDDCVVDRCWIREHARRYSGNARLGGVFARVSAAATFDLDHGWLPAYPLTENMSLTTRHDVPMTGPMGANMSFRRRALTEIGGFDEMLGPGAPLRSADDIDALHRLLVRRWSVELRTTPTVTHLGYRDYASGSGRRALADTMFANGAYLAKHMRCGDRIAGRAYAKEVAASVRSVALNILERRKPYGFRRPAMLVAGLVYSHRFPVCPIHQMYRDSCRSRHGCAHDCST